MAKTEDYEKIRQVLLKEIGYGNREFVGEYAKALLWLNDAEQCDLITGPMRPGTPVAKEPSGG